MQDHLSSSGLLLLHEGTTCWSGSAGAPALHSVGAEGVLACRVWASWSDSTVAAESIAVHTVLGDQPGGRQRKQQRQLSVQRPLQETPGSESPGRSCRGAIALQLTP